MQTLIEVIKEIAPGAIFYVALAVGIGWYLKHLSLQIVSNFKAITEESRQSYSKLLEESRLSKEEIKKDLEHYKLQLEQYRKENAQLIENLENVRNRVAELEGLISEVQKSLKDGFKKFAEGMAEFETHSKALFSERDNILRDLELAWKAILRQHSLRDPDNTALSIEEFKGRLMDEA